jgi:hypothetical protein|tara:strand:- start:25 stop:294 length:270 start_codon:yes stop_codon:yes gene_type:complete
MVAAASDLASSAKAATKLFNFVSGPPHRVSNIGASASLLTCAQLVKDVDHRLAPIWTGKILDLRGAPAALRPAQRRSARHAPSCANRRQ